MLIKDLLKEFTFDLKIKNYSKRTMETYNYNVNQLMSFLGEHHDITDIEDVSSLHIKKFVQYQLEIGNKSNYINTIIKSLRAFYSYLVSEEYVSLNVLAKIKLLKEDKVVIKTFTDKEVAKMIDVYDFKTYLTARNKVILAMFVDTGIGIDVSPTMVSKVNDKILPLVTEWKSRPLERVYPIDFLDAIHFKVRKENFIVNKAAYSVFWINVAGEKEILGIWIGESESASFWLGVCTDLKNQGVEDILIACKDGLSGFSEAISTIGLKTPDEFIALVLPKRKNKKEEQNVPPFLAESL